MKTKKTEHRGAEAAARKALRGIEVKFRRVCSEMMSLIRCLNRFDQALDRVARGLPLLCVLCASVCILAGCASTDGRLHSPVTGAQVEKAYRLAGEQGYLRQQVDGEGRWMNIIQLEGVSLGPKSILALKGPELLDAQLKQQQVFRALGRTDAQIVQTYNSRGVVWGQLADGAITTAVLSGLVAGIAALADGSSGGGSSSDSAGKGGQQATGTTINQISGSPGATINNDGGEGAQSGGGSGGSGAAK